MVRWQPNRWSRCCYFVAADATQWRGGERGRVLPQSSAGVSQPGCKEGGHTLSDRLSAWLQVCVCMCVACNCYTLNSLVTFFMNNWLIPSEVKFLWWPRWHISLLANRTDARGVHLLDETLGSKLGMEHLDIEEVRLFQFFSDTANARQQHVLVHFMVNGKRVWTSQAQMMRRCFFCLLPRFSCTYSSARTSHWSSWMAGRRSPTTCALSRRPYRSALSSEPRKLSQSSQRSWNISLISSRLIPD